jgi:uncharacterized protein YdhG (YjbR/CyaY superfamily)
MKATERRPRHRMPADVKRRLEGERLMDAYARRPPYQRNDYLGWISQAKRDSTREKRIARMLEELKGGEAYMGMAWKVKSGKGRASGKEGSAAVDAYMASLEGPAREALLRMRALVRSVAPDAEERISYGMPAFYRNGPLVFYAAFKDHIGFYPLPDGVETFAPELAEYERTKGSIHFPLGKKLPAGLVKRIVKYRLKALEAE